MPLNKKGKKIKKAMTKQYGKKKGESVFYAMENSGKLRKVIKARGGDAARSDAASGRSAGRSSPSGNGGGRDPSAQYRDSKPLSQESRQALESQRERARGRISPSTTPVGKSIAAGIGAVSGIPFLGYKIGQRMVDYSPMAFGVPKSTRPKQTVVADSRDRENDRPQTVQQPIIPGPVAINQPIQSILPLSQRRVASVSPTGRFNYALRKGGMLIKGKPKLTKKGWK